MSRCRDAQAGSVSAYFVGSTRKSPTMRQPAVPKMIWGRAGNEKEQGRALAAPDKARSRLVARGAVHDISLLAVGKREESSSPTREQGDTKQQGPTRESGALLVRWGAVLKQGSGALAHACSNSRHPSAPFAHSPAAVRVGRPAHRRESGGRPCTSRSTARAGRSSPALAARAPRSPACT